MKQRVYVAGPITKGDLRTNIKQATDASVKLMKAGFAPFCPHLTCYMAGDSPEVLPHNTTQEDWYGIDLPWVAVADVVLRLPGESRGADLEVQQAKEFGIPVYIDVDRLITSPPPCGGHQKYHKLLKKMSILHDRKAADYGTDGDPFANVRASTEFGVPAWLGVLIRANDKWIRLKSFARKGKLENEPVEDSLMDLAAYALISLLLWEEGKDQKDAPT